MAHMHFFLCVCDEGGRLLKGETMEEAHAYNYISWFDSVPVWKVRREEGLHKDGKRWDP